MGGSDDQIFGDGGNDFLKGGDGADTFVFVGNFGNDRIIDFSPATDGDVIDLSGISDIASFDDLVATYMSQIGSATVIDDLNGNTIRLENVNMDTLTADDFLF